MPELAIELYGIVSHMHYAIRHCAFRSQQLPPATRTASKQLRTAAVGCAALALLAWALPAPTATLLLVAPLLEEIVFRAGLQDALARAWAARADGAELANVVTAAAFALAHMAWQDAPLSALTLGPALVIGSVYQVHERLAPCVVLHALFNALWLLAATHS